MPLPEPGAPNKRMVRYFMRLSELIEQTREILFQKNMRSNTVFGPKLNFVNFIERNFFLRRRVLLENLQIEFGLRDI